MSKEQGARSGPHGARSTELAAVGTRATAAAVASLTLDELGLGEAADVLVPLDLVAAVGAACAVVLDGVRLLQARVGDCGTREGFKEPSAGHV
jgi:hypothetical protein